MTAGIFGSIEDQRVQTIRATLRRGGIELSGEALGVGTASKLLGACICKAGAEVVVSLTYLAV